MFPLRGEKCEFLDTSCSTDCKDWCAHFVRVLLAVVFQPAFETSSPVLGKGRAQSCADSSRVTEDIRGCVHFLAMGQCG